MRYLFLFALCASVACSKDVTVVLDTSKGPITVHLDHSKAPATVDNFVKYMDDGFYDGTVFHRVIRDFMIQGGGYTRDMQQKAVREPVKNEADNGLLNKRGTLAMARTGVVDSATSQFFINVVDNPRLDHRGNGPAEYGYCVFGDVIDGMDTVEAIRNVTTWCPSNLPAPCDQPLPPGMRDVPAEPVVINKVSRK